MKKLNKTYYGIPKTPIDDNTVFYWSGESSTAEIGGALTLGTGSYRPMPTGIGYKFNGTVFTNPYVKINDISSNGTIEFLINLDDISSNNLCCIALNDGSSNRSIDIWSNTNKLDFIFFCTDSSAYHLYGTYTKGTHKYRLSWGNGKTYLYEDGKLISIIDYGVRVIKTCTMLNIGNLSNAPYSFYGTIADLSISNIDRSDYFPTLPKDFIDGKAIIAPSFNPQRKVYSDALTPQYTLSIVKGNTPSANQDKCCTITQAVSGNLASGDTIKVKGLGGEIIGGVVDSDTALATITIGNESGSSIINVDDVSKFSINDIAMIIRTWYTSNANITISSIDSTNKTITVSGNVGFRQGDVIVESTTSSSSPLVKYSNAGVLTTVTGTWSNLGTNEATFTLGTNASLTNQDIQIEYSLNMVAGQGQVPVYSDILGGDVNGKKVRVGTVAIRDDFKGKLNGSTIENPHTFKTNTTSSLLIPTGTWYEISSANYPRVNILDNTVLSTNISTNGQIAQQLLSFNLIRLVEDKYGKIPAIDKVQWLKDNLSKITYNWYGYGTCPSGNKAYLEPYCVGNSSYDGLDKISNTTNSPSLLSRALPSAHLVSAYVDVNGFINLLAYSDASDGVTASTIYTDYCYIDVELKMPTGYTALVPDNPRRDEGWHITMSDMKKTDDFSNKVSGSVVECPHIFKRSGANSLQTPAQFSTEIITSEYDIIKTLNNVALGITTNVNTGIAQDLSSFNIVEYVERRYGKIPAVDKIAWIKANINKITCNWRGYGSCPNGNKAYLKVWDANSLAWTGSSTNTTSTPSLLIDSTTGGAVPIIIDPNGFIHFLAYTDASDGVAASTIYTDYINIEVELKDTVIPVLDYFKGRWVKNNVLLVRKETREVQTYFPSNDDVCSVVGQYIPYKGLGDIITKAKILAVGDPIITTLGTGGSDNLVNHSGIIGLSSRIPSIIEDYKLTTEKFKSDGITVDIDKLVLKPYTFYGDGSRRMYPVEGVYLEPNASLTIVPIRGVNKRPFLSTNNVLSYNASIILQLSLPQTLPSEAIISLPLLVTENSKIYMVVLSTKKSLSLTPGVLTFYSTSITYDVFDINGKPLLKG